MGLNRKQLRKLWADSTRKQRSTIVTKGQTHPLREDDKEHVINTEFNELPFWAMKIVRRGID